MKPFLLKAFAAFGALSLAAWIALGVSAWTLTDRVDRRSALSAAPIQVSPVAARIAAKLAPSLQALATENKAEVVAASGGPLTRLAVRTIYPAGVQAIPYATQIGCDRALSYLDGLSVAELVGLMTDHARAKRHEVHPSVARQAGIR